MGAHKSIGRLFFKTACAAFKNGVLAKERGGHDASEERVLQDAMICDAEARKGVTGGRRDCGRSGQRMFSSV